MFDYAEAAVEAALGAGARYADARVMDRRHESMGARNGEVEELSQESSVGVGVRALIGSGWGFFSTADLTPASATRRRVSGRRPSRAPVRIGVRRPTWSSHRSKFAKDQSGQRGPRGPARGAAGREGRSPRRRHPRTMKEHGADVALAGYDVWDTTKWLVSSPRATGSTSTSSSAARR